MSIYDQFNKRGEGGDFPDFFRFDTPGVTFSGHVKHVRTTRFPQADEDTIILDVVEANTGAEWSIPCGSTALHNQVLSKRPEAGDGIMVQRGPDAGRAHTWVVEVTKANAAPAATAAAAPAAAPAPAAAAAPPVPTPAAAPPPMA